MVVGRGDHHAEMMCYWTESFGKKDMGVVSELEEAGHEDKQQMYFANTVEWRLVDTSVTPPSSVLVNLEWTTVCPG